MKIAIYQINMDRDTNRIAFMSCKNLERFQRSPNVDCKIYDKVFEGDIDCNNLESIYRKFNLEHPADYVGRSLSVSDVVEVQESDSVAPGFYFCDDFGFKEIEFDKSLCPETERKPITDKISVLLVQPDKRPKLVEIGSSLEEMQAVVGGDIAEYMPFGDDVAIVCNEEGKINGLPLNRAIYSEPIITEMDYRELKSVFREAENSEKHITGYIVFSEDSFDKPYSIESRTYFVSSNNKAYQQNMGGYSIYGSSLDGKDICVRLEGYMKDEQGGIDGWKIEKCYTKDDSRKIIDIVAGDFFITYAPIESEKFLSLPKEMADKYAKKFKNPERFFRVDNEIKAIPYNPQKDIER